MQDSYNLKPFRWLYCAPFRITTEVRDHERTGKTESNRRGMERRAGPEFSGSDALPLPLIPPLRFPHPDIQTAAVVARPEPKWGEAPCAFVELRPGASATQADIIAFCRSQLAGFKTPKSVIFEVIPKTSTGKIQKFQLRNRVKEMERP